MNTVATILTLAAKGLTSHRTGDALQWGGLAVLLIVAGIIAIAVVRKKLLSEDSGFNLEGNFTLSDLRRLLADGRISQNEFDRAKQIILARSREMLHADEEDSDNG
jgi:hypothetical protein